jgi:hypothetical protein
MQLGEVLVVLQVGAVPATAALTLGGRATGASRASAANTPVEREGAKRRLSHWHITCTQAPVKRDTVDVSQVTTCMRGVWLAMGCFANMF